MVKVFIQTGTFEGGPVIFRDRLIESFKNVEDIKVTNDPKDNFDVELAFIRKISPHNKPYILRVDGCYYEFDRRGGNKRIKNAIKKSSYLIFQSKFSFELCEHVIGIKKYNIDYSVIHNGINIDYIKSIEPSKTVEPGSFISCAGWRPNKRPLSTIKGFIKAKTGRHLYMIGGAGFVGKKISKKYNSKYIHILDKQSNKKIISIMKACDYQIHLCHIDSCPNAVLEGLSCGLNVLCTNLGGTMELVRENGVVLQIDKLWEGRYMFDGDLDNVKSNVVAKSIHKLLKHNKRPIGTNFDIKNVANSYAKILKKYK